MRIINGERRYNVWAGNPQGRAEDATRCIEEIHESGRGGMFRQCDRKRGQGPDGLYCKRHSENFISESIATWYCTMQHGWEIKAEPVYKETEKTLLIKQGQRLEQTAKRGYYDYWPTREAARSHLRKRIERMRADLAEAEKQFNDLAE